MSSDYEDIRGDFEKIEEQLQRIATSLQEWLYRACSSLGIYAPRIEGRCKTARSLVLKVIRKDQEGRPYVRPLEQMSDKVGVRADLIYAHNVDRLVALIRESSDIFEPIDDDAIDDKRETLGEDQVGYSGVHIDVVPKERFGLAYELAVCEIQVRTNAQAAWAMASHQLVYKPLVDLNSSDRRRVNRLTALVELFDEQVAYANELMKSDESYPLALVLDRLETARYRFTSTDIDRALTHEIVSNLVAFESADDATSFADQLDIFVDKNSEVLRTVMASEYPLLASQPEAILLFYLLEQNSFDLQQKWAKAGLSNSLLDSIANKWGAPLPTPL